jgi:hypothetical protein
MKKTKEQAIGKFKKELLEERAQAFYEKVKARLFDAMMKEFKSTDTRWNLKDLSERIEKYLERLMSIINYSASKVVKSENIAGKELTYIRVGIEEYVIREVSKFKMSEIHKKKKEFKHDIIDILADYEDVLRRVTKIKSKKYRNSFLELKDLESAFPDISKEVLEDSQIAETAAHFAELIISYKYGYGEEYVQKMLVEARKKVKRVDRFFKKHEMYFKKIVEYSK